MRVLALVVCSCGRINFDPSAVGVGGPAGDGGPLGDGAAFGDGANADDVVAQPLCGSTVLLSDDFEDGVVAPEWTVASGTGLTVSETGGFLQITFANSNVPASQGAGYVTTAALDFTGGCLDVELVTVPNPATSAEAVIEVQVGTRRASFFVSGGTLNAWLLSPSENDYAPYATYDAVAERWLRIVENASTWFFQTSPDGAAYTTFFAMPFSFTSQSSTTLSLEAWSTTGGTMQGQARFGSVRITGP